MALTDMLNGGLRLFGLKLAIAAELVYQLVGSNMSSPQTAELNAGARAPTISKWVNLTVYEAIAWLVLLSLIDRSWSWIIGGGIALVGMWLKYKHAISAGLSSGEQATENYT